MTPAELTNLNQLAEILPLTQPNSSVGLCNQVYQLSKNDALNPHMDTLIDHICKTWKHYSGDPMYPIAAQPDQRSACPMDAYYAPSLFTYNAEQSYAYFSYKSSCIV